MALDSLKLKTGKRREKTQKSNQKMFCRSKINN